MNKVWKFGHHKIVIGEPQYIEFNGQTIPTSQRWFPFGLTERNKIGVMTTLAESFSENNIKEGMSFKILDELKELSIHFNPPLDELFKVEYFYKEERMLTCHWIFFEGKRINT